MKGNVMLSHEKYNEAIPVFEKYLDEHPDSIEARSRLGFAYLKTGRLDEAISTFREVIKVRSGEPYSVLYLGTAYLNKGEIGRAIETWREYRDEKRPLVEAEIKRQLTLLQISESQRLARESLINEQKLTTVEPEENTIAVCYYKDLSPDKSMEPFQKGLASMVITDLSKIKSLKVVERIRFQTLMDEMKLGRTGIVDAATAPRVGMLLGAKNVVVGSLGKGSIAVVTTINDQSSAATVAESNFWEIPSIIIHTVVKALGITLSNEEEKAVATPHTKVLSAFMYYGKALMARDAGKWQEAKDLFAKAVKEDPFFLLAKEGGDNNPTPASPSVSTLSTMTVSQIVSTISTSVASAQEAQGEADARADTTSGGGGGDGR
jgi:tetratricopeptide (TPR) repeat protein